MIFFKKLYERERGGEGGGYHPQNFHNYYKLLKCSNKTPKAMNRDFYGILPQEYEF